MRMAPLAQLEPNDPFTSFTLNVRQMLLIGDQQGQKKNTPKWECFLLAPPAGLEPATTCINPTAAQSADSCAVCLWQTCGQEPFGRCLWRMNSVRPAASQAQRGRLPETRSFCAPRYTRLQNSLFSLFRPQKQYALVFGGSPTDFALSTIKKERMGVDREVVDWRSTGEQNKRPPDWVVFVLAPPAGLEPATS